MNDHRHKGGGFGLEHLFEKIAALVDESIPTGSNWHQELLRQMNIEVPGVRPAVISAELRTALEEYRGFCMLS